MASSSDVQGWVAIIGSLLLVVAAWRDIRKQTIAGSLPTEYTQTLQDRVKSLETRMDEKDKLLDQKDKERDEYARKTRNWYYAAVAANARGEVLPVPPEGWP